jgi:hypothetical protein
LRITIRGGGYVGLVSVALTSGVGQGSYIRSDRMSSQIPHLIRGNIAIDDRGTLFFVNDFSLCDVKRFYVVNDHRAGFVRAWHAHRREAKYVAVWKARPSCALSTLTTGTLQIGMRRWTVTYYRVASLRYCSFRPVTPTGLCRLPTAPNCSFFDCHPR